MEELKVIVEKKHNNEKCKENSHADITPFFMSMIQQKTNEGEDGEHHHRGQVESLNAQRRELEQLRNELRKHEQVRFWAKVGKFNIMLLLV